jgi:hypothetical protein
VFRTKLSHNESKDGGSQMNNFKWNEDRNTPFWDPYAEEDMGQEFLRTGTLKDVLADFSGIKMENGFAHLCKAVVMLMDTVEQQSQTIEKLAAEKQTLERYVKKQLGDYK